MAFFAAFVLIAFPFFLSFLSFLFPDWTPLRFKRTPDDSFDDSFDDGVPRGKRWARVGFSIEQYPFPFFLPFLRSGTFAPLSIFDGTLVLQRQSVSRRANPTPMPFVSLFN